MDPLTNTETITIPDAQRDIAPARVRDRCMAPLEGEKRLMVAVLERAVEDFRTYAMVPTGRGRWLLREVAAWFESSAAGPFDFEGICQATGLEPDCIRKAVARYRMQRSASSECLAHQAQSAALPAGPCGPRAGQSASRHPRGAVL